ncbi:hypothetical protein [Calothrix sp. NIES-2100]
MPALQLFYVFGLYNLAAHQLTSWEFSFGEQLWCDRLCLYKK